MRVFAWDNGDAGFENKHELPPPIDTNLYFGNAYVLGYSNGKHVSIDKEDFRMLSEIHLDGCESLGSTDSWSSDDDTLASDDSLNDFIVPG